MIYLLSTSGGIEFENSLKKELKDSSNILFIPFAKVKEKRKQWIDVSLEQYESIGIEFKECHMIEEDNSREQMIQRIKKADIISIMGGNPLELMDKLEYYGLVEYLRNFKGTIVATSAGTLTLCNYCILTKDDDFKESMYKKGFGIVDINIAVHYYSRDSEMDRDLRDFSKAIQEPIYGLGDFGNVIMFDGNKFVLLGDNEIHKYENGYRIHKSSLKT